jgi:hypothetical protein
MPKSVMDASKKSYSAVISPFEKIKDAFSPDLPPAPETPAPPTKESAAGATQAEERSLLKRKGLRTTKKVKSVLNSGRPSLGQ